MTSSKNKVPLNILLADDDMDDRFFFEKALYGLTVPAKLEIVPNGERLMEYLNANLDNLPDMIFLDLNMPRKNGNECLVEIKQDKRLQRIPVIIYSTSLLTEIADVLYINGAHFYLQKCVYSELIKCIKRVFQLLDESKLQPTRDQFIIGLKFIIK
jgi:CheY-like chemotaxis protein